MFLGGMVSWNSLRVLQTRRQHPSSNLHELSVGTESNLPSVIDDTGNRFLPCVVPVAWLCTLSGYPRAKFSDHLNDYGFSHSCIFKQCVLWRQGNFFLASIKYYIVATRRDEVHSF